MTNEMALLLSAAALIFAGYQSYLNRAALVDTRRSVELATRAMQIECLPDSGVVIFVQAALDKWIDDLSTVIEDCRKAARDKDAEQLRVLSEDGLKSPARLVNKYIYDNSPPWLKSIHTSAAQFYYDAKAPQVALWGMVSEGPFFKYVPKQIERCEDSIRGLRQLSSYIKDIVPDPILNTPASIADREFIG